MTRLSVKWSASLMRTQLETRNLKSIWERKSVAFYCSLILLTCLATGCSGSGGSAPPPPSTFANPQRVTILGYSGDAMEPSISRDGRYLFFNSLNTTPPTKL